MRPTAPPPGPLVPELPGIIGAITLFSICANLLLLAGPLFMMQVYDRVLASGSVETLVALFALVCFLFAMLWVVDLARVRVAARLGARLQIALGPPVFRATMKEAGGAPAPGAHAPLEDLGALGALFLSPGLMAVADLPWAPVFLGAMFLLHPDLGWLAVAGGGVLVAAALLNQALTARRNAAARDARTRAARIEREAAEHARFLRAQGMSDAFAARWDVARSEALGQVTSAAEHAALVTTFARAFRLGLQAAILALGALLVLDGRLTGGAMIAASVLFGRALAPVEQVMAHWPTLVRGFGAARRMRRLPGPPPPATTLPRPAARLDLSDATLSPGRDGPAILERVAFILSPGEALGVVGRSGAGKTTLARAVTGQIAPARGEILLGGASLPQYGDDLGRHIGYLPQDPRLFEGTIAENIARMATDPDSAEVVAAARRARVHEVILALPRGYDTRVGPGATDLSGGQVQRVALARALYGAPVLLVLDEPSSALDAEGSGALAAVIAEVKAQGGAVLLMSHRAGIISLCDRVVVLDGGRMSSPGPTAEILKTLLGGRSAAQSPLAARSGA